MKLDFYRMNRIQDILSCIIDYNSIKYSSSTVKKNQWLFTSCVKCLDTCIISAWKCGVINACNDRLASFHFWEICCSESSSRNVSMGAAMFTSWGQKNICPIDGRSQQCPSHSWPGAIKARLAMLLRGWDVTFPLLSIITASANHGFTVYMLLSSYSVIQLEQQFRKIQLAGFIKHVNLHPPWWYLLYDNNELSSERALAKIIGWTEYILWKDMLLMDLVLRFIVMAFVLQV